MAKAKETTANLPVPVQEREISLEVWSALTTSLYPGAATESVCMVWDYCKARKLDPLKKPVHIVPMDVKNESTGEYQKRDIVMPGIGELRITAFRTGQYAGMSEPEFGPEIEFYGHKVPSYCKLTVYRIVGTKSSGEPTIAEFPHIERFEECAALKRVFRKGQFVGFELNSMWARRKYGQLLKCTEAGALRKAFPEELGNILVMEEMIGKELNPDDTVEHESDITMPQEVPTEEAEDADWKPVENPAPEAEPEPAQGANPEPVQGELVDPPAKGQKPLTDGALKLLRAKIAAKGMDEKKVANKFGAADLQGIYMEQINQVLDYVAKHPSE